MSRRFLIIDVEYEVPEAFEEGLRSDLTETEMAKSIMDDIILSIREVLPVVNVDILNEGPAEFVEDDKLDF